MIKQNLHTHSLYCDGKNTIEDMTLEAIQKGFNDFRFFRTWELSRNR